MLTFMFQENLENIPSLYQGHLRAFCDSAISHLKGGYENNLELNINFTDWYLARSPRAYLFRTNIHFFSVIQHLTHTFSPNDQVIIDTFRLILNKEDEAVIMSKAALFCLEYLCDVSSTLKDARRHLRVLRADRKYRNTRPWRWHQRRLWYDLERKVMVQSHSFNNFFQYSLITYGRLLSKTKFHYDDVYPLHSLPWIHWNFLKRKHRAEPFYRYRGFLEYLAILLPRAGRFSPLIHLCKTKVFVPMSMMFPDESRKARRAIAVYLDRMEDDIVEDDAEQTLN